MHNLIQAFVKQDIMLCKNKVVMVDERGNDQMGVDLKGICCNAISCFWHEFYNTCNIQSGFQGTTLSSKDGLSKIFNNI